MLIRGFSLSLLTHNAAEWSLQLEAIHTCIEYKIVYFRVMILTVQMQLVYSASSEEAEKK